RFRPDVEIRPERFEGNAESDVVAQNGLGADGAQAPAMAQHGGPMLPASAGELGERKVAPPAIGFQDVCHGADVVIRHIKGQYSWNAKTTTTRIH
ncbi:MAG: hypothetical protein PWQ57_1168, partial [Desulfovibrionales bacterium]|nr:hypothetical protein [Desulfovibrionales bacterium]